MQPSLLILATAIVAVAPSPTTAQKRPAYLKDLQAFFQEVDKSYPFFKEKGIAKDWKVRKKGLLARAKACKKDADFIAIAGDALRGLRDGHAGFVKVRPKLPKREPEYYAGVVFLPATKGRVVAAAVPRSLEARLPVGAVVLKIDGKKARTVLDKLGEDAWQKGGSFSSPQRARFFEYRLPLRGERGDKHVIEITTVKRKKQKKRKVTLRSEYPVKGWLHLYNPPKDLQKSAKSVYHTALNDDTGYIWLRRMDATAEEGVSKAIAAHSDPKKWIVDLRGNTGGGYDRSFKTLIANLGKRVAVIIDAGSISAAETFTRDLVNVCKAKVFGARSAGSSSSKKVWDFPSGIASIRYSIRSRSGVGGKAIEFHGIAPSEVIEADPDDVANGRNTEILAAQGWLNK